MTSPLQPGDHYILQKLCNELLPWMISGRRVGRQWFVRTATFYGYGGDTAAALAGLGIGTPLAALVAGKTPEGKSAIEALRQVLPEAWMWVGGVALGVWVVLRLIVQREDIVARALLARDCAQSMKALRASLWTALPATDPMPKITEIQRSVDDKVQNAIKNKVWPWEPLPSEELIQAELKLAVDEIRIKFMNKWAPAPPGV
ncbi:MAG: hypothetical protein ACK4UO_13765 [Pseudolabrys sp.]